METNAKKRWQIRLAVLVIFAIGFIAGALAMNLYKARQWSSSASQRGRFERIFDQLDLTGEQREKVKAIFEDARKQISEARKESEPRFQEVRRQTDERLQAVLTPEQWEKFQQIMSEPRGRRKRDRMKH
jgi:Spy/CpxP family protein refolding chaperone